ncbi:MAG: hypothetical protein LC664_09635 [Flavobacteriales bacterium]|nr:hypothetical protein [Flavobacteriales bacterium]
MKKLSGKWPGFKAAVGVVFVFCSIASHAQILNPPEGKDFNFHQKFNPEFIKLNKIEKIRCDIDNKKDGDRIRHTFKSSIYEFYPDGRIKMISQINHKLRDTLINHYTYAGGRLACEVKNDAAGMFSYCYVYDDGKPTQIKYGRSERYRSLTASVNPDLVSEITSERYEHKAYGNQMHSTLYNNSGRPYQKEIRYYDEHGYMVKYLKTFVMSSSTLEEQYRYNERGWLDSLIVSDNGINTQKSFTYDEVGNLQSEDIYREKELIKHREFVYKSENMFLRAELTREEKSAQITITEFTYTFRKENSK